MDPFDLPEDEFRAWWAATPSQAEMQATIRRQHREAESQREAAELADWRARHPAATCRDGTALRLMRLEATFGKEKPACPAA